MIIFDKIPFDKIPGCIKHMISLRKMHGMHGMVVIALSVFRFYGRYPQDLA